VHRTPEDGGKAGAFNHLSFQKGSNGCDVTSQVDEQANFWGCEGFLPEVPQNPPKIFLCNV